MAEDVDRDPGGEVEVALALGVVSPEALSVREHWLRALVDG